MGEKGKEDWVWQGAVTRSECAATEQEEEAEHGNESHGLERRHDSPHQLVNNGDTHHPRPP